MLGKGDISLQLLRVIFGNNLKNLNIIIRNFLSLKNLQEAIDSFCLRLATGLLLVVLFIITNLLLCCI